jgi:hypothetical protein
VPSLLLRLLKGVVVAIAGGYILGTAGYFLDYAWGETGLARRALVPVVTRGLTAEAPARIERYEWIVQQIPEKEYHGGERLRVWPELLIAFDASDGRTHRIQVRGLPNNSWPIQTYMAHFAGIFGLPWIDYVLPDSVVRRLSYDPHRPTGWSNQPPNSAPEDTYDTGLVAFATDQVPEQLGLMWAARSPRLTVRYDPTNPSRAYPTPLLAAWSRPLSKNVEHWIEGVVFVLVSAMLFWHLFATFMKLNRIVAAVLVAVTLGSVPFWTGHINVVADVLGVSRLVTEVAGRGMTNPIKLHRIEVQAVDAPKASRAVRWSVGDEDGTALLAALVPHSDGVGWEDLLSRSRSDGSVPGTGPGAGFVDAIGKALAVMPDDQLGPLLERVCVSNRSAELLYKLGPVLKRIASDEHRPESIRERAANLTSNRAFCR